MKTSILTAIVVFLLGIPLLGDAYYWQPRPDLRLTIAAPESLYVRFQRRNQLEADGIFISVSAGNSFQSYGTTGLSYPAASSYVGSGSITRTASAWPAMAM